MAALNFPTSPAINDVYTANGQSYRWDGASWIAIPSLTGGTINGTSIGATTPSTGAFTTFSASGASSFTNSAPSVVGSLGFRNRIMNGDMRIDQRRSGASVTLAQQGYTLDRWHAAMNVASKFSVQQTATGGPDGFPSFVRITSTSAYSIQAADVTALRQPIEGYNVMNLEWGTSNAKTVTLSFYVRSSLTGTFGGSVKNADATRSYAFTFTISSANTWEYKTITIAGDTTGTWQKTSSIGMFVTFGLGVGSNTSATAGSWGSANYNSATGAVSVVGTNGATFDLTAVQLERGNAASEFERRHIGMELSLCQRYYWRISGSDAFFAYGTGSLQNSSQANFVLPCPVEMRSAPIADVSAADTFLVQSNGSNFAPSATGSGNGSRRTLFITFTVSGATSGHACTIVQDSTDASYIGGSAEL